MSWLDFDIGFDAYKEPITNFSEAIRFFEHMTRTGDDACWSIKYYGFGEHLTYWLPDASFIDFNIDHNSPITWDKLKEIIINSAEAHRKKINERRSR